MSFQDLHYRATPLLLPNAWDVPSAVAFLEAGFEAIGTTSFGVASSLGCPDGRRLTREANLSLARRLSQLGCYISMDIEDGYADAPDQVADYAAELGVAGINIEDSTAEKLIPAEAHAAKLAAIKRRCPALFVNARVDTYWLGQDNTAAETLRRATRYVEAGANGVFLPGISDPALLRELTRSIPVPVNVLVIPALSLGELARLGVRRVSTGSLPYRAAIHAAVEVAEAARAGRAMPAAAPYQDLQARLVRFEQSTS
jgi:2-methylisocitrate lyase-like PEP mutase family enzyme